mgnify:CR=1 FL=1
MTGGESAWWGRALETWTAGGWLMVPLFALTVFIYYTAWELLIRLNRHRLIRAGVDRLDDRGLARRLKHELAWLRPLLADPAADATEVRRHFDALRLDHIAVVNRRIRFLAITATAGPLVGLLGTVTGMLATFSGLGATMGVKFTRITDGISEALITTQAGLIVAIPALVLLSLIVQRRRALERGLLRLESYSLRRSLRRAAVRPVRVPGSKPQGVQVG